MPHNEERRPQPKSGAQTQTTKQHTNIGHSNLCPDGNATAPDILDDLADAPIIPLAALLLTDASPREIARRLRLNTAIRMLLDAIRESEVSAW